MRSLAQPAQWLILIGRTLAYAWAAPCSVVGLAVAALLAVTGANRRVVSGVLEVWPLPTGSARRHEVLARSPFSAITLGHVTLGVSEEELVRLRSHEHAHVRQYERWGVAFLLAYPAASVWQALRGRRAHADNPFEIQARDEAMRFDTRAVMAEASGSSDAQ